MKDFKGEGPLSNELAVIANQLLADRCCGDCGAPIYDWAAAVAHAGDDGFACVDYVTRQGPTGCRGCPYLSEEGLCDHPAVADYDNSLAGVADEADKESLALGEVIRNMFDGDDTVDCPGREDDPATAWHTVARDLADASWWKALMEETYQRPPTWRWSGDGRSSFRLLTGPLDGMRFVRVEGVLLPDLPDAGTGGVLLKLLQKHGEIRVDWNPPLDRPDLVWRVQAENDVEPRGDDTGSRFGSCLGEAAGKALLAVTVTP